MSLVADDAIYTSFSIRTIPHRIRVRQVLSEIHNLSLRDFTYADVGCGGGSVTQRIVDATSPAKAVAYDANPELIDAASHLFPRISFRVWNLAEACALGHRYDLVTCLETLEHVHCLGNALHNLVQITAGTLLITVPIEIGVTGLTKFVGRGVVRGRFLTEEHAGSPLAYAKALLIGDEISTFRAHKNGYCWVSHTGFDYRLIDVFLSARNLTYVAMNKGWNRFYKVAIKAQQIT